MPSIPLTLDEFRASFPVFKRDSPRFSSAFTDEEEAAYEAFFNVLKTSFDTTWFSYSPESEKYVLGLYIAHVSWVYFLPTHGKIPQILFGDQSGASTSEGQISVSYSRISYREFLSDVYLSFSSYGALLAHFIRKDGGVRMLVTHS